MNRCNGHTRRDEARYRLLDDGALVDVRGVPAGIEKERAEPVAHRRRDRFHVPAGSVHLTNRHWPWPDEFELNEASNARKVTLVVGDEHASDFPA